MDSDAALADMAALEDMADLVDAVTGALMEPCATTARVVLVLPLVVEVDVVVAAEVSLSHARLVLPLTILSGSVVRRSHPKECVSGHACGHVAVSVRCLSLSSSPWSQSQYVILTVIAEDTVTKNPVRLVISFFSKRASN